MNRSKSLSDRIGLRRLTRWVSRSRRAILADLDLVDCGSLDVLLYCPDDLAVAGPGDVTVDRSRR